MCYVFFTQLQKLNYNSTNAIGKLTSQTKQKNNTKTTKIWTRTKRTQSISINDLGAITSDRGPETSKLPHFSRGLAAKKEPACRH